MPGIHGTSKCSSVGDWLLSLSTVSSRSIHVTLEFSLLRLNGVPWVVWFIHWRQLGLLHSLTPPTNDAGNLDVRLRLWDFVFASFGPTPIVTTTGSDVESTLAFLTDYSFSQGGTFLSYYYSRVEDLIVRINLGSRVRINANTSTYYYYKNKTWHET